MGYIFLKRGKISKCFFISVSVLAIVIALIFGISSEQNSFKYWEYTEQTGTIRRVNHKGKTVLSRKLLKIALYLGLLALAATIESSTTISIAIVNNLALKQNVDAIGKYINGNRYKTELPCTKVQGFDFRLKAG